MTQNYIGKSVTRYDGIGHVTGRTTYVDDIQIPGMLYVKVLHSPVHKGVIRDLDLTEAQNTPGVAAVISAKDIPGKNGYACVGISYSRFDEIEQPVFASKHIRYKGERIAALAAVDEETALEALGRIKLDIEEQTPVFDPLEAIKPGAPLVRPEGNLWRFPAGNLKFRLGNVDQGFAEADHIVEGKYTTAPNVHAAMEPRVSVAYVDATDRLVIHTVSQQLALLLKNLCPIFNLPASKVCIIGGTVGGGFGGKNHIHCDHVAGLLALKTRRPVKYRLTRAEDLSCTTLRGGWIYEIKDGVKKDGRVVARQIREFYDMGAYPDFSPSIMEKMGTTCAGPYYVPNVWLDGYGVYTNKPPASAMRGFHLINLTFALETQMNRVAEIIGMDPWELRFINAWRNGDLSPSQWIVEAAGFIEAMKKTAELAGIDLPDRLKAMNSERRCEP